MKTIFKHTLLSLALLAGAFTVQAQVKIGSSPTVIGANSYLEVEATNGKKVIVDKTTGTMKVENKPLAPLTDSIVTRGMDGELHQISRSRLIQEQKIPVTIFSATLQANSNIPVWVAHNQLDQRIPLTPRAGYQTGWNPATKQFTIPENGFYQVEVGLVCVGTGTVAGTVQYTRIWSSYEASLPYGAGGGQVVGSYNIVQTGADQQSVVWSGEWPAGSTVSLLGMTYPFPGSPNPTYGGVCVSGYMNITKTP